MNDTCPTPATSTTVLERNKRLSQSLIWQLQQNFYNQLGIEAWRQGTVPHYITSNPFIAQAYARVVAEFLHDCQTTETASNKTTFTPLDFNEPVYIVELGAGSGRFSYHFLKKFIAIHQASPSSHIPIKYIMTDCAPQLIEYWRSHDYLTPLVEAGLLDFAHFTVGQDDTLELLQTGDSLTPETVKNPMVVLANYVFDSTAQDCFYIKGHRLFESLVTIAVGEGETDLSDPSLIERLTVTYKHEPAIPSYYNDREFNQILRSYQHQLHDTTLLFPYAALSCLRQFRRLSHDRLLLLSGDKGYIQDEALEGWGDQELTIHGSFSMMVNYHAIAQYVHNLNGQILRMDHGHHSLNVSGFLLGQHPSQFAHTRQAYQEYVTKFGPDDFFVLREGVQTDYGRFHPEQIIAFLRLSGWDPSIFFDASQALHDGAKEADEDLKKLIRQAVERVWEIYYPIGEVEDIPFQLGMLLYQIDAYAEALIYFNHSLRMHGPHPSTSYNMSLCHNALEQLDEALKWIEETLTQDAAFDGGNVLFDEIQAKLAPA